VDVRGVLLWDLMYGEPEANLFENDMIVLCPVDICMLATKSAMVVKWR
jgi:hypothetical protein